MHFWSAPPRSAQRLVSRSRAPPRRNRCEATVIVNASQDLRLGAVGREDRVDDVHLPELHEVVHHHLHGVIALFHFADVLWHEPPPQRLSRCLRGAKCQGLARRRYCVAHQALPSNRSSVIDLSTVNRDRTGHLWAARVSIPAPWECFQNVRGRPSASRSAGRTKSNVRQRPLTSSHV